MGRASPEAGPAHEFRRELNRACVWLPTFRRKGSCAFPLCRRSGEVDPSLQTFYHVFINLPVDILLSEDYTRNWKNMLLEQRFVQRTLGPFHLDFG